MGWMYHVKIKHLFTENEDHESVQASMNAVADVIDASLFFHFYTKNFRCIPEGDEFFSPSDYANTLLERMYDYADANRIWIE